MKRSLPFLIGLAMAMQALPALSQNTLYVKKNATGANTGATWQDAFTELHAALDAAANGDEIWVAAGTYKPQATPANASLLAATGVKLYGGFVGTETSLSQRNPQTNLTILSGDQAGDDLVGDFTQRRSDNARHVLVVSSSPQQMVTVDGFHVRGGHTLVLTGDPDLEKRGGGILATTPVVVRNCVFTDNFAVSGAGVACIGANASASVVEHSLFEGNQANGNTTGQSGGQSAGLFFRQMTSGTVRGCVFRNNMTYRGAFYPNSCKTISVDSCLFENNTALPGNFGGAMFTWQSSFTMTNCVFRNNVSANAGALYNDGRDGGNYYTIRNCLFESNETTDYGGSAMYNWKGNFELDGCQFKSNKAPTSGAAIYNGSSVFAIKNCLFEDGQAGFGAGVANYSAGTLATYENCTFKNNRSATSGGAMTNGFLANVTLKNCTFDGNGARWGGAVYCQNDSTTLSIEGCNFIGNVAENYGGAVNVGAGIAVNVKNSTFNLNSANFGGAISITEDSLDLAILNVENSTFNDNFANQQAAGINALDAAVTLTNCLFFNNLNFGDGAGGALSNNASDGKIAPVKAVNCTFFGNDAPIGAGLAQWEDTLGTATLTLQNCVLQNAQNNYDIEAGAPDVFTVGGNLSSDATLAGYFLTAQNDLNDADPGFVDAGNYDFKLLENSLCIDRGTAAGAPTTDLLGLPRHDAPDAGCFEHQKAMSAGNPNSPVFALRLAPNPTADFAQASLENDWNGAVETSIAALGGQVVRQFISEKTGARWQFRAAVSDLPTGVYLVRVRMGKATYAGSFVKE